MATMSMGQSELWRTLFSGTVYKAGQGNYARLGTLIALLVLIAYGGYAWSQIFPNDQPIWKWGLPVVLGGLAAWIAYRMIHFPPFADFLIATESEMVKVKWPTARELRAATFVILANVIILALFLFITDIVWRFLLYQIGVLRIPGLFLPGSNM
ncbi:preprotein translocase subunit SecE [bacterium]|nr:preprotein translocase subunit SecE [bacterium]